MCIQAHEEEEIPNKYNRDREKNREDKYTESNWLMSLLPPWRPVFLYPALQQPQYINALVDAAKFSELSDRFLVVAQQELLGGAVGQGALGPVLQQGQFVIAHPPAACKVLPVFDGAVVWIQFEPQ